MATCTWWAKKSKFAPFFPASHISHLVCSWLVLDLARDLMCDMCIASFFCMPGIFMGCCLWRRSCSRLAKLSERNYLVVQQQLVSAFSLVCKYAWWCKFSRKLSSEGQKFAASYDGPETQLQGHFHLNQWSDRWVAWSCSCFIANHECLQYPFLPEVFTVRSKAYLSIWSVAQRPRGCVPVQSVVGFIVGQANLINNIVCFSTVAVQYM